MRDYDQIVTDYRNRARFIVLLFVINVTCNAGMIFYNVAVLGVVGIYLMVVAALLNRSWSGERRALT